MNIEQLLTQKIIESIQSLYSSTIEKVTFEKTNSDFEGDFTLVVFNYLKISKKRPEETANEIGNYLKSNCAEVSDFNVVKGFLNIVVANNYWLQYFQSIAGVDFSNLNSNENPKTIMVEYSSPNTNKPLHLGHVRNNLLGYSISEILKAAGNRVIKTNLVNDRGIHICKSMLAWQKWGNNETPESTGIKGDHLVGKYYVMFDRNLKLQISELKLQGINDEDFEINAPLMQEAKEMLRKWEEGDVEIRTLWKMMNDWVYKGFGETYKMLGVDFDKTYYESNTYLLGKNIIEDGLAKNVLKRRTDNSVFIDLTSDGLDEKTLLRADGTSLYMTQDLGTALQRYEESKFDTLIFTVANEQDYHFKVLSLILNKLEYNWAKELHHLSYGMVELPEGKMKSREGTVVDADELMHEMIQTAAEITNELGKTEGLTENEITQLSNTIGLGALKYFILKVDPKKKMLFNPKESIDFNGNTASFIQFNYVRVQALVRKAKELGSYSEQLISISNEDLLYKEKELIKKLYSYNNVLQQAAQEYSPAVVANYCYNLAKEFSQYYHDTPILKEEKTELKIFRLQLCNAIGQKIKLSLSLLGIEVPEKM